MADSKIVNLNNFEKKYSKNWKNIGGILLYQCEKFQFKSDVIITELDGCIIKYISQSKIYNTMNLYNIEIFDEELIDMFRKEKFNKSIIIISNQINQNKLNIDIIKRKIEYLVDIINIPLLCFFPLKPNCFMKPHTGCWKLLKAYYKKYGNTVIQKAQVISNEGGLIQEKVNKSGYSFSRVCSTDIDRAFALNAGLHYSTIDEFLKGVSQIKFKWDTKIIPPDIRQLYVDEVKKRKNPNIFQELNKFINSDLYVIMIMGAPRSGKTKLAKNIINKWCESEFGKSNAIERLGTDNFTSIRRFNKFKKLVDDRISVIIDGDCHTEQLRLCYVNYLKGRNIPILCIEVNCGLQMAKVFNHAHVEESNDDRVFLYRTRRYDIYKAEYEFPIENKNLKYLLYTPEIEEKPAVMEYRY